MQGVLLLLLNSECAKLRAGILCPVCSRCSTKNTAAEDSGLFLWENCYSKILFSLAMKAGGTNDIYEGLSNHRPVEKHQIIYPSACVGSVSAARAYSYTVPSMCRMETNLSEKLQLTKGGKMDRLHSHILIHSLRGC